MAVALMAGAALADAPATSVRPLARPVAVAQPSPAAIGDAASATTPSPAPLRPRARPVALTTPVPSTDPPVVVTASAPVPPTTIEPAKPRKRLFGRKDRNRPRADLAGSVCGDPAIRGVTLAPIGSGEGCGIAEPVQVTGIDGIALSTPATMDCKTAKALRQWIDTGLRPAFGRQQVTELRVAASYVCRSRNNRKGAPLSEHGRGKAIDISAFVLSSGKVLTVASDWRGSTGKPIRSAYKAACGIFGTTLGPGSDGYHEDHLHFDTKAHRNGAYCR